MEGFTMFTLRSATINATYQILGTETPDVWMRDAFTDAIDNHLVDGGEVEKITAIRGATDFFTVDFKVEVCLNWKRTMAELFADAKSITDHVVGDTDTVITQVSFNN